jgi:hypothetical protein
MAQQRPVQAAAEAAEIVGVLVLAARVAVVVAELTLVVL